MRTCVASRLPRGLRGCRALALVELLVAVCCVALVLTPFVLYLREASLLQVKGSLRGRELAQGAYQRQVLLQGIDPQRASHFGGTHPLSAGMAQAGVERGEAFTLSGAVSLVPLGNTPQETGTAGRVIAVGLELGAGEALPPPDPVREPALPLTMRAPVLSPANGSLLLPAQLSQGRLRVSATSPEGGRVVLELRRPLLRQAGSPQVGATVPASALLVGIEGEAWVEFAGTESARQRPVELPDGRLSWYVEEGGGIRRYLPSARVPLRYRIYLGTPVLVLGEGMHPTGAVVPVDFRRVQAVRSGGVPVRIQWPDTLLEALGEGASLLGGFTVSFEGQDCDNQALGRQLFGPGRLSLWAQRSRLRAQPLVPASAVGRPASWQLERTALQLPQPIRVVGGGLAEELPAEPGSFEFRVSELPGVGTVGRLSAREGTVLGAGGVLQLEVLP